MPRRLLVLLVAVALGAGGCTGPEPARPAPSATPTPRHVVTMQGELIRAYSLPTLEESARQPQVVTSSAAL